MAEALSDHDAILMALSDQSDRLWALAKAHPSFKDPVKAGFRARAEQLDRIMAAMKGEGTE